VVLAPSVCFAPAVRPSDRCNVVHAHGGRQRWRNSITVFCVQPALRPAQPPPARGAAGPPRISGRLTFPAILPIFYLGIRILRVAAWVMARPGTGVALPVPGTCRTLYQDEWFQLRGKWWI